MSAKGIGVISGIIIGLIICVVVFKICNKNNKIKSEYDERQEVVRGRAYKYGFYAAIFYLAFLTVLPITEIETGISNSVLSFAGLLLGICVMAVYAIWNDAYWGINNNHTRYLIVFSAATLINLAVGIMAIVTGDIIEDGVVQDPAINLLCGVMFLVVSVALVAKNFASKTDDEEEA